MADYLKNLDFEDAGRIRDEIKRLQATELTIADDPFVRQQAVEEAAAEAAARKRPRPESDEPSQAQRPGSRGGRPGSKPTRGRRR
jgi:excinuclease ABC subunit B